MMKKNISLFILLSISVASFAQQTKIEEKIDSLIFSLPEVKERADYVEKQTKGERHLKIWIYQTPKETKEKCYWVKVGENNEINFVSHFNFFVYPNNFEIKYYNAADDTILSLDDWRKKSKIIVAPTFDCHYKISFLNQSAILKRRIGLDTVMQYNLYGEWRGDTIQWDTTYLHEGEISFIGLKDSSFDALQEFIVTDCSGEINYEIESIGIDITGSDFRSYKSSGGIIDLNEIRNKMKGEKSFCSIYEIKFRNIGEPLEIYIQLF